MAVNQRFYSKKWFMWLMVFTFPYIAIPLMWRHRNYGKITNIVLTCYCTLASILFFISLFSPNPETVQQKEVAKNLETEFISETCRQVSDKFDASSRLSNLQKDELWKNYKGKKFKWNLRVTEVSSNIFGGYHVVFKCEVSRSLIVDISLEYPEKSKSVVLSYKKGEIYTVKGVFGAYSATLSGLAGLQGNAITDDESSK